MFSRKCRTLTVLILLLVVIGVIMVGSSSRVWASAKFNDASYFMSRQAVFALIGVFVMYVASRISLTKLRRYGKKLFILCVIALILVLIPGLGIQRNGSRSWFGVGSFLILPSLFTLRIFWQSATASKPLSAICCFRPFWSCLALV